MQASEQRGRGVLEQDAAVAHEAARAALLYLGVRIAVERERQLQPRGLLAQARQDGGVALVGQNQVGIVPLKQVLEGDGGRLARFVQLVFAAVHFDFERRSPSVLGSMRERPPNRTCRI